MRTAVLDQIYQFKTILISIEPFFYLFLYYT